MQPVSAIDVLFQPAAGTCSSPEAALAEMDESGVAVAFVAPCTQLTCERQWACVDSRLEDVGRFLSASIRFAGCCGFNPFDAAESLREIESARALGFRAVYVQLSAFGLPLEDSRYYPLFGKASEMTMPAVVQFAAGEQVEARVLRRIGRDFPELSLAVGLPHLEREVLAVVGDFERLGFVLDARAVATLGAEEPDLLADARVTERCMWGSGGAPLHQALQEFRALPLSVSIASAILRDNALRFFAAIAPARLPRSLDSTLTSAER